MGVIPFDTVQRLTGNKHPVTYWRWERSGWFPQRVHIGPHSVAWRESDIQEWLADPVAWRDKHQAT